MELKSSGQRVLSGPDGLNPTPYTTTAEHEHHAVTQKEEASKLNAQIDL